MESNNLNDYSEKARKAVIEHIEDLCDKIANSPEVSLVENSVTRIDIITYLKRYAKLVRDAGTKNIEKPVYSADLKNEKPTEMHDLPFSEKKALESTVEKLQLKLKTAEEKIHRQETQIKDLKVNLYDLLSNREIIKILKKIEGENENE